MLTLITARTAGDDGPPICGIYLEGMELPARPDERTTSDLLCIDDEVLTAHLGECDTLRERVLIHDEAGDFEALLYAWVPAAGPRFREGFAGGPGSEARFRTINLRGFVIAPDDAAGHELAAAAYAARPQFL